MHTSTASRLIALMMVMVLLATSGGCMTTSVWNWAGQTEVSFKSGQGIAGDSASGRSLVLLYANESEGTTMRIPLRADGRPCPPFDGGEIVAGSGVDRPQLVVDESQVIAIAKAAGAMRPFKSDSTFKLSEHHQQFPIRGHPLGVTAIAYRIRPDGEFVWVTIPEPSCTTQSTEPVARQLDLTGVRVAVIPDTIFIPSEERRSRKTLAALATPFTAVGDAAVGIAAAPVVVVFAGYVIVYLVVTPKSQWVLP